MDGLVDADNDRTLSTRLGKNTLVLKKKLKLISYSFFKIVNDKWKEYISFKMKTDF